MRKPKILVIGSINQDIIYHTILEEGVQENGMVYAGYHTANGGKGANQAAALSRLGADVYLAGCVGDDGYGKGQLKGLQELGVHTDYVRISSGQRTGLSVMLMRKDSTYIGANVLGANGELYPDVALEAIQAADFDMILMQLEMPLETVYRSYEAASERGIPVILDPGPAKTISLAPLKNIFLITPNEDEAEALTGIRVRTPKDALHASRVLEEKIAAEFIVLKLGSHGAFLYQNGIGNLYPAFPAEAVDSTAAGDSFTAELAIRLCLGDNPQTAVTYANAAGAICVSRPGGQPSVPDSHEIEQFLQKQSRQNFFEEPLSDSDPSHGLAK